MIDISQNTHYCKADFSRSTVFKDDYRNVLSKFEDGYFDLALCDIPYGIDVANMAFFFTNLN